MAPESRPSSASRVRQASLVLLSAVQFPGQAQDESAEALHDLAHAQAESAQRAGGAVGGG